MMANRRAGVIFVKVDGELVDAKGNFTYNLGQPMREAMVGASGIQGFKETPQVSFIEGEITDRRELDMIRLIQGDEQTVTLELNNGKVIVLNNAWFAGDGQGQTEEANITVRWESAEPADEMR
jgi:23S rRNA U2552 (ribose-2'-O)-methylase RlmE/FtsJ